MKTEKQNKKTEEKLVETETATEKPEKETSEEKTEEKKDEKKKKQEIVKKYEAIVNGRNLRISTKKAGDVCRFIKWKKIQDAIQELEKVAGLKKPIPMKGEYAHQKGKGISSGGYPKKTAENFIILLKSLQANANAGNMDEPIIAEAIANIASKPYGKMGKYRKKRSHVTIKAIEKNKLKKEDK